METITITPMKYGFHGQDERGPDVECCAEDADYFDIYHEYNTGRESVSYELESIASAEALEDQRPNATVVWN